MMKIGILTYHRSHNYGALLQAIALREILISFGHNVYFIDYWPNYHKSMYKLLDISLMKHSSIIRNIKYLMRELPILYPKYKRIKIFKKFIHSNIEPYTKPYPTNESFDTIIYGSDQIWRKQSGIGNRLNPVYFGENNLKATKHVAYSASMGNLISDEQDLNNIKSWLSKFSRIAVRETNLLNLLKKIGFKNTLLSIDPTLLLTEKQWRKLYDIKRICKEPYILYFNLMEYCFDLNSIRSYAKSKRLKLIILESGARHVFEQKNTFQTASPEEFLSLICFADHIFTSSFHGLAFSLIFHKEFHCSFRSNSERAHSLLSHIGLEDRLLKPLSTIPFDNEPIDYTIADSKLSSLKKESIKYLASL